MEEIILKKHYNDKITEREIKNSLISQKSAEEGIVLLKNDGVLPLKHNINIALYGAGARKTVKGGWGSGDVNERKSTSIEEGLKEIGYKITTNKWINEYDIIYNKELKKWKQKCKDFVNENKGQYIMDSIPFISPCGRIITDTDIKKSNTNVAIYVLSRTSGEGADRKNEKGDFKLFDEEIENLKRLVKNYKKVILIINSGGIIDTSFLKEIPEINAIIYMSQAGCRGGNAIANILSGKVTPSGKLSDTWASKYEDYPVCINNDKDVINIKYKEGIFVGYRYFDTFNIIPNFEFGYGLSYTQFSININDISIENEKVLLSIKVKNIGKKYKGKEVVQIYISCSNNEQNKEYQRLVGFKKTKLLKPGEEQEFKYIVDMENMKSYNEKIASWILEKGKYTLRIGNSSRNTETIAYININKTAIIQKVKNICNLKTNLKEYKPNELKREDKLNIPTFNLDIKDKDFVKQNKEEDKNIKLVINKLETKELFNIICGAHNPRSRKIKFYKSVVPGAVGETTSKLKEKYSIENIVFSDGPAGIHIKQKYNDNGKKVYQYCTAMPIGVLLAQTWNEEILKEVGYAVAQEMKEFGISVWLAPGMNIHRDPLCGRNFEYFSEDPFLTGKVAGNIVLGLQNINGISATLKHFACNNKENNRIFSNSIISEKALREIYLRGFEIAIKLSNPRAIMTSYNKINGVATSNSYDLCTEVLRNEWEFNGVVMTDWFSQTIGDACAKEAIKAGNDLIMPGNVKDIEDIEKNYKEGKLDIEDLKKCATNILKVIIESNKYVK